MRIFFAVPRSAWVDLNLRRSLEDMGHELVRFDFPGWPDDADPAWSQSGKPRTNQRLLEKFPTAGLAVIDFPVDDWAKLHPKSGRLDRFVAPRLLDMATD